MPRADTRPAAPASAALLTCAAHLALPVALTVVSRRARPGSASRVIGRHADVVYDAATVALAGACAVSRRAAASRRDGCDIRTHHRNGRHIRRGSRGRRGATVATAAVAGAVLPTVVRALAGSDGAAGARRGPASAAPAPRPTELSLVDGARVVACATAEEVLWRDAAPRGLRSIGVPSGWATALAAAGFVGLHARGGGRRAAYHLLTAAVFTAIRAAGGPVASAACHAAHNLALAAGPPRTPQPEPEPATAPSRRDW